MPDVPRMSHDEHKRNWYRESRHPGQFHLRYIFF